jgi:hypothetical protein
LNGQAIANESTIAALKRKASSANQRNTWGQRRRATNAGKTSQVKIASGTKEQERATLERDFRGMATKRAGEFFGWGDEGKYWQATPQPLRDLIESYNKESELMQTALLERWISNPKTAQHVAEMMAEGKKNAPQKGQSLGR